MHHVSQTRFSIFHLNIALLTYLHEIDFLTTPKLHKVNRLIFTLQITKHYATFGVYVLCEQTFDFGGVIGIDGLNYLLYRTLEN